MSSEDSQPLADSAINQHQNSPRQFSQQLEITAAEKQVLTGDLKFDSQFPKCLPNQCPNLHLYHESNWSSSDCTPTNYMASLADYSCHKEQIYNVISKECHEIFDDLPYSYISGLSANQLSVLAIILTWVFILVVKLFKTRSSTTIQMVTRRSLTDNSTHNPTNLDSGPSSTSRDQPKMKEYDDKEKASIINNSRPGTRSLMQTNKLIKLSNGNKPTMYSKHMPWFGIDIGGSLVKVVFFDPVYATQEEGIFLRRIRHYLKSSKAYGTTGKRDAHLELPNCIINKRLGCLHFIRFATSQMQEFLLMVKNKHFADIISHVCATGGGACKFEQIIKTDLGITLQKSDELDSLIHGIHYVDKFNSSRECYFFRNPLDDKKCLKEPYDFSQPYPYLVVNIGSGVSILAVYSSTSYSRISGSSIGGGTFLGLCCLLTGCKTFDEAIRLAKSGTSAKVDKLVKDIYGGDYLKLNLPGETVASSFGNMMQGRPKDVSKNDLARALLEMVTLNIGSLAGVWAATQNIDRLVFIGNFLRFNQLSMKLLSYAVDYWSKGAMKALFLEHEGYFGAVGCFVESTVGNLDGVDDD